MQLDVVIAGARGSGLKVLQILEDLAEAGQRGLNLIGFVDDNPDLWDTEFFGYPVFGPPGSVADRVARGPLGAICSIGDSVNKRRMVARLAELNITFPNAIHPSAQVSRRATLGEGNVLAQNVVFQPGVTVGSYNTFNIAALMGPLAQVGNYCAINTHVMLASESVLGDNCYVGMGAKILQRLNVAEGTIIGACAFVNKEFPAWSTVVGVPARLVTPGQRPSDT